MKSAIQIIKEYARDVKEAWQDPEKVKFQHGRPDRNVKAVQFHMKANGTIINIPETDTERIAAFHADPNFVFVDTVELKSGW